MKFTADRTPGSSIEEPIYAKDSWYKAYTVGNIRMPQVLNGMAFYTTGALLNDEGFDYAQFTNSRLSPEQVETSMNIMNNKHREFNIPHIGENKTNIPPETQIVTRERLEDLWKQNVMEVERSLLYYICNLNPDYRKETNTATLNDFFRNSDNANARNEFKNIIFLIKKSLSTEEAKTILTQYKNNLQISHAQKKNSSQEPILESVLGPLISWEEARRSLLVLIRRYMKLNNINMETNSNAFNIVYLYFGKG